MANRHVITMPVESVDEQQIIKIDDSTSEDDRNIPMAVISVGPKIGLSSLSSRELDKLLEREEKREEGKEKKEEKVTERAERKRKREEIFGSDTEDEAGEPADNALNYSMKRNERFFENCLMTFMSTLRADRKQKVRNLKEMRGKKKLWKGKISIHSLALFHKRKHFWDKSKTRYRYRINT